MPHSRCLCVSSRDRLKYPCTATLTDEEDIDAYTVLYAAQVRLRILNPC